jgi:hypothetical protein
VEQAAAEEQKKSKHVSWKKPVENAEQEPVANNSQTSNSSRLSTSQIIGIILAVIVFILFSFFIGYLINKNNV